MPSPIPSPRPCPAFTLRFPVPVPVPVLLLPSVSLSQSPSLSRFYPLPDSPACRTFGHKYPKRCTVVYTIVSINSTTLPAKKLYSTSIFYLSVIKLLQVVYTQMSPSINRLIRNAYSRDKLLRRRLFRLSSCFLSFITVPVSKIILVVSI